MKKSVKVKLTVVLTAVIAAVAAFTAILPRTTTFTYANSGRRYEYGVTASGAVEVNEQSVLAVESEKLTFDIVDFPNYPDVSKYKSTVTAEYKFVNTSENAVTASMAFPIGTDPMCEGEAMPPVITLNGENVAYETRHTYGSYSDFDTSVGEIYDGFYNDGFYTPETPVTEIKVKVAVERFDDLKLIGKVSCGDKARFTEGNSENEIYFFIHDYGEASFYVFGDTSDFVCEWRTEEYVEHLLSSGTYQPCERAITVTEKSKTTLKEFALEYRQANSTVSEADWYNACVSRLGDKKNAINASRQFNDYDFTAWYLYDISLAAGESVVNTVTSPILPSEHASYQPPYYTYEYYLSPAATWKSFGKLEVYINTNCYISDTSSDFEKCEGGYKAEFETLPKGDLRFTLCESENPKLSPNAWNIFGTVIFAFIILFLVVLAGGFIAGITVLIVFLVRRNKKS